MNEKKSKHYFSALKILDHFENFVICIYFLLPFFTKMYHVFRGSSRRKLGPKKDPSQKSKTLKLGND